MQRKQILVGALFRTTLKFAGVSTFHIVGAKIKTAVSGSAEFCVISVVLGERYKERERKNRAGNN